MSYINLQDLKDELGEGLLVQLSDNDGTGEIDTKRIDKAINAAEGEFNSYIRDRYTLPVPATQMVKTLILDMTVYHLYKRRVSVDEGVWKVQETVYKNALKLLENINKGKAALDIPASEETITNPTSGDTILTNKLASKFTDSKLSGF
jgi:phage gp36-like protein